jgi:hypothetical protein
VQRPSQDPVDPLRTYAREQCRPRTIGNPRRPVRRRPAISGPALPDLPTKSTQHQRGNHQPPRPLVQVRQNAPRRTKLPGEKRKHRLQKPQEDESPRPNAT